MGRIVTISSGKGGVGKTTTVANLAAALSGFGKSVIIIDGNLTTSNLGLHLGVPVTRPSLQDVIKRKAKLESVIWRHPAGFKVVPADVSVKKVMSPKAGHLLDILNGIVKDNDFILIDSAAGLCQEALSVLDAADELLIVTNPELPALTDALKLIRFAERYGTVNLGVVVNRVSGKSHEWTTDEIEEFLGVPVIAKISEDRAVQKAIAEKVPVVLHSPSSKAALQFKHLAAKIADIDYRTGPVFIHKIFGWLAR